MNAHQELFEYIQGLWIIDTHEHLPEEADRGEEADVLSEWLTHYFSSDLVSAGLSDEQLVFARDSGRPLMERWRVVEPYWDAARSTGYGRALDLSAEGVYGIGGVRAETLEALDEAFQAARRAGNHYRTVLKENSRIERSLVVAAPPRDEEFFACVPSLDDLTRPTHLQDLRESGQRVGVDVHGLEDWEQVMELTLERMLEAGAVAVKCGLAYKRPLRFEKVPAGEAEADLLRLFDSANSPPGRPALKPGRLLQDYMVHHMLALANRRGLTVQFHTGIQEGNGNVINDSNPTHLTNVLLEYDNVRFDLFHMGYPYCMELGNLAKNFRNVYIDMCWGHIISPEAARRALIEWLDAVPANKICAFGGDYCFVDGVYGHQLLARRNVAASLSAKVADGSFDLDRAKHIARMLFVDNPTALFHLA